MYTKIETEHGPEVLWKNPEEFQEEGTLPPDVDTEMSVEATARVMR